MLLARIYKYDFGNAYVVIVAFELNDMVATVIFRENLNHQVGNAVNGIPLDYPSILTSHKYDIRQSPIVICNFQRGAGTQYNAQVLVGDIVC